MTSVCTGSLILGAAGLLKGRRAACHWAWRDLLTLFGAIPDPARVVRDGNVITGGGVTAGIDFALTVAAELAGAEFAQGLQLGIEYAPGAAVQRRTAGDGAAGSARRCRGADGEDNAEPPRRRGGRGGALERLIGKTCARRNFRYHRSRWRAFLRRRTCERLLYLSRWVAFWR